MDKFAKPRRGFTAYMMFVKTMTPQLLKDNPNGHFGATQITKFCSEKWAKMTEEDKQPYEEMKIERLKFADAQEAELKEKGYFTMPDGSKNTDRQSPVKKQKV